MENVGGVFLVMLAGLVCACLIALVERLLSRKISKTKTKTVVSKFIFKDH